MLFKQTKQENHFDLFKKNEKKTISKKKKTLRNVLIGFLNLQLVFGAYDLYMANNYVANRVEEGNAFYTQYNMLDKSLLAGNQNDIIDNFTKLKNYHTAVADLIASGKMDAILLQDKETPSEYRYKIDDSTLKTINYIYQKNWNSGLEYEKKEFSNYNCFYIDLTCHIGKHILGNMLEKDFKSLSDKLISSHYNATHTEEVKAWQKKFLAHVNNKNSPDAGPTPGDRYLETIKK